MKASIKRSSVRLWFYFLLIGLTACSSTATQTTPIPVSVTDTPQSAPAPTLAPSATLHPSETPAPTVIVPTATQIPKPQPGPRAVGDMVFHEGLGMVVMLNGSRTDSRLWGWDGNQWRIIAEDGPRSLALGGAVYDPKRAKLVVYGGYSLTSNQCQYNTWEWDEQGWQQLDVPSPEVCSHFVMEYDHALEKVILFGGGDDQQNTHAGLWTWDGQQWEKIEIETPAPRFHTMSASDATHHSIFLIGGFDLNYQIVDEFWAWDGTTWEQPVFPRPTALSHARMVFDSKRAQLVLFGGSTRARLPLTLQADTWVLTEGVWQKVDLDTPVPSPRGGQMMAYDPLRDRVVLYGGFDSENNDLADTWEWDGSKWWCRAGCDPNQAAVAPPVFGPKIVLHRGDAHHSGVYNLPAIRTQPQQRWQANLRHTYLSSLIHSDGVLYFGHPTGKIFAYDALTGVELWQGGDLKAYVSAFAIAGDVLIAGGYNKIVQALDRRTGEAIWTVETDSPTLSPPLIEGDRVYIPATQSLYALALQTGEVLWTVSLDPEAEFIGGPAYESGKLFLPVGNSFVARDAETGAEVWRTSKERTFYFFAIDATTAYAGNADGFFYAFDLMNGRELWRFEGGGEIWFGPAVTTDTVYVGHFNGFMYALDKKTGEKRWEYKTDNWAVSEAVIVEDVVYFTDCWHEVPQRECHLYAVKAETGEALWQYAAEGTLMTAPVFGEAALYFILSGSIVALK